MKNKWRDTIMAISGIIISITTGVWTLITYNANQEKKEIEIIATVSSEISSLNLAFSKNIESEDNKKYKETLRKLRSDLPYLYIHISKPLLKKKSEWDEPWEQLIERLDKAFEESTYEGHLKHITSNWDKVVEMRVTNHLIGKKN